MKNKFTLHEIMEITHQWVCLDEGSFYECDPAYLAEEMEKEFKIPYDTAVDMVMCNQIGKDDEIEECKWCECIFNYLKGET